MPTGLLGLLGGHDGSPWLAIEVSARSRERRREVRLHCAGGVAVLGDGYADRVELHHWQPEHGADSRIEHRPISTEMPLLRELRAFVEHLGGGPPPRSSAREGLADVAAIADLRRLAGLDRQSSEARGR